MSDEAKQYPDVSDIIAARQRKRLEGSRMSFGEKIELVEKLRLRLAPFKQAREARAARKIP